VREDTSLTDPVLTAVTQHNNAHTFSILRLLQQPWVPDGYMSLPTRSIYLQSKSESHYNEKKSEVYPLNTNYCDTNTHCDVPGQ
jgi:hypothetical protein